MTKVKWELVFVCLAVIGATLISPASATTSSRDITVDTLVQLTTDKANDLYPAWSPAGNKIAFVSGRPGDYDIWVMDSNGSNQKQLTTEKLVCNPYCPPAWSPDGKRIAFVSYSYAAYAKYHYGIWVMDIDGSNKKQLIAEKSLYKPSSWISWSPDGKKIAFVSRRVCV